MRTGVHGRLRFRLTLSDADAVQFFFADYYRWRERARGCTHEKRSVVDDQLEVIATFADMRERSFRVAYTFCHLDGSVAAHGFTQHVTVDLDIMKACPVPAAFRDEDMAEAGDA